jgi:hypothetical protein
LTEANRSEGGRDHGKTLHRIYLFLYLQFVFYWATIAAGMLVNYYYVIPDSLQPDFTSIFLQLFADPSLFTHVVFAVLSTSMSIPVIVLAKRIRLMRVVLLHAGAISVRMVGFVCGMLFMYFGTSSIGNGDLANLSTFIMASVFLTAVILTFMSRIFIVSEDVRIKYQVPAQTRAGGQQKVESAQLGEAPKGEEIGHLGLVGLRIMRRLCYANFIVYLVMYVSGMYINLYITSGVKTIGIGDFSNMIHMVAAILNFVFTFTVMLVGFLYAMRKVAMYSLGAVVCLIIGTLGGLVFLETGGGRTTGDLTLAGGWIMSILFMLALFLSYYATLKIVRAIKVFEATNRT